MLRGAGEGGGARESVSQGWKERGINNWREGGGGAVKGSALAAEERGKRGREGAPTGKGGGKTSFTASLESWWGGGAPLLR